MLLADTVLPGVLPARVLLTDTVLLEVLPVRDCYWQIQCYQNCYQSERVVGRYIVISQRVLLSDTVLPEVLPV